MLTAAQRQQGMISPAHPVPEFLCHLYSMVNDPTLADVIRWIIPLHDEKAVLGGGYAGIGKIVIWDPRRLQDEVLGKYYRHSKYSSFQRQLNYFAFKKRLHGLKKGKMCACSFVHAALSSDPHSLLALRRRPPSGRKAMSDSSDTANTPQEQKDRSVEDRGKTGGHLEKRRKGFAVPPTALLAGTSSSSAVDSGVDQRGIAPAPLHMPQMNISRNRFGTNTSHLSPMVSPTFPNKLDHAIHVGAGQKSSMSALRANDAILEAQQSLARNFLKSQQEQQKPANGEQKPPPQLHRHPGMIQQQQPLMNMSLPGLVPAASAATAISGGIPVTCVPATKPSLSAANVRNENNSEKQQQEAVNRLPKTSNMFPHFTAIYPQANAFNNTFASVTTAAANSNSNDAHAAAVTTYSNSFENRSSEITNTFLIQSNNPTNLLDTPLTPFVFDDDLSTGSMSDFGATPQQIANASMLFLP